MRGRLKFAAAGLVIVVAGGVALSQVVIGADGRVSPLVSGVHTWAHVASPYLKHDGTQGYRHTVVRVDLIAGLGGPYPMDENGGSGANGWRMALYTTQDRYPTVYLPSLGDGYENLAWAEAVARVVEANPGGIVELEDWLP